MSIFSRLFCRKAHESAEPVPQPEVSKPEVPKFKQQLRLQIQLRSGNNWWISGETEQEMAELRATFKNLNDAIARQDRVFMFDDDLIVVLQHVECAALEERTIHS